MNWLLSSLFLNLSKNNFLLKFISELNKKSFQKSIKNENEKFYSFPFEYSCF